jgi:chloride channel 7
LDFFFPYAFPCEPDFTLHHNSSDSSTIDEESSHASHINVSQWLCGVGYYNSMAELTLNPGHDIIRLLLRHDNVGYFSLSSLGAFLVYYFLFAAWCAGGLALSSGFVVPMIAVGAVYGRIIGKVMLFFTQPSVYNTPGIYALLGSAAFFAGVSRLSVSLTIIMIELSGDVLLAFPLMVSIMVAKNFADLLVHPLYHEQLALKGVPYLDSPTHELASMRVSDVMTKTVIVLREVESIARVDHLLSKYDYSSFPIVGDDNSYKGMIHRREIKLLLSRKEIYLRKPTDRPNKILTWYEYKMLSIDKGIVKSPHSLNTDDYQCFIDFGPYLNTGIYSVPLEFFSQ